MDKTKRESGDGDAGRSFLEPRLLARWEVLLAALPAVLRTESPDAVHDARVASRRVRAAMDVARPLYAKAWYRRLRRTAKELTRTLGGVRDRDVLLALLAELAAGASEVEAEAVGVVAKRLGKQRGAARKELARTLKQIDRKALRRKARRRFAGPPVVTDPAPLVDVVRSMVAARLAPVRDGAAFLSDPDATLEHHQLRIAVKRLRYTLEVLDEPLGEPGAGARQRLAGLQDALGRLHDHDILIAEVKRGLKKERERRKKSDGPVASWGMALLLARVREARLRQWEETSRLWAEAEASGLLVALAAMAGAGDGSAPLPGTEGSGGSVPAR